MPETRCRISQPLASALALVALLGAACPGSALNVVHDVGLAPGTPAALQHGTHVDIAFGYETDDPGGARIWFRPITEGSTSPNFAAHGSPLYFGAGGDTAYFTITAGEVLVDQVRVQMWNADESVMLYEDFYPVRYHYAASGEITHIELAPPWPATLLIEEQVNIAFDYQTPEQEGVLIFFRPMTGEDLTPNYGAHPSPVYPVGTGAGSGWFTILAGETPVDAIRVTMTDPTETIVYHEFRFPVEYHFAATPAEAETWGRVKARYR